MKKNSKLAAGFSLLELLCVLLIIAIISSMAYPSYSASLVKTKRLEAKSALLTLQNQYERYFIVHNSYQNAKIGDSVDALIKQALTSDANYTLEITKQEEDFYLLSAHPYSAIAKKDQECASFTLSSLGEQGISGNGNTHRCWN